MGSQKEVRTRIATVKTLHQVSGAMRVVASSKLLKTQKLINGLKPFQAELKNIIRHYRQAVAITHKSHLMQEGKGTKVLVVAIASNKGKCGAYNQMIAKKTIDHLHHIESTGMEPALLVIGKKAEEMLVRSNVSIEFLNHEILDNFSFLSSNKLAEQFIDQFTAGDYCRIDVVYGFFRNAVIHDFVARRFLPMDQEVEFLPQSTSEFPVDFDGFNKVILEPDHEEIAKYLIPNYIKANLYFIFLNAIASENGARMVAMQKASDNALEVLKALSLALNKERQSLITREIVEIVSGAEAMGRGC